RGTSRRSALRRGTWGGPDPAGRRTRRRRTGPRTAPAGRPGGGPRRPAGRARRAARRRPRAWPRRRAPAATAAAWDRSASVPCSPDVQLPFEADAGPLPDPVADLLDQLEDVGGQRPGVG